MSATREFRNLLEELRVFDRNLRKDGIKRRKDILYTNRKLKKINKLKVEFRNIRESFNTAQHESGTIKEVT